MKIVARRFSETDVQEETEVNHHLDEPQPEHDAESMRPSTAGQMPWVIVGAPGSGRGCAGTDAAGPTRTSSAVYPIVARFSWRSLQIIEPDYYP
jgi:hypothetical protein